MKTPNAKALASLIILSIPASQIFALNRSNPRDTTRNTLISYVDKKTATEVILKEANVVFPSILSGNEPFSLDYVEHFSKSRKTYLERIYKKSKTIFPQVVDILKQYDVPQEFKVLLALESGFNPNAVSPAGAVGYWQLMDEVAKEYGLRIGKNRSIKKHRKILVVDERKNFTRSTHAAAKYLKDRSRNLNNDWLLIAASYNCGIGNVWSAMERSHQSNPSFWDIKKYLPAETRSYVMNFIALNVIFHNYENFSNNKLCFKTITCQLDEKAAFPSTDIGYSL